MAMIVLCLVTVVAVLASQFLPGSGQNACDTLPDLQELSTLINLARLSGDNPTLESNAIAANFVCLRPSPPPSTNASLYSGLSVVVNHTCLGGGVVLPMCTGVPFISQFDFECRNGAWQNSVLSNFDDVITENPIANLSTPTRTDCVLCATQMLIDPFMFGLISDEITHCVRKLLPIIRFYCDYDELVH